MLRILVHLAQSCHGIRPSSQGFPYASRNPTQQTVSRHPEDWRTDRAIVLRPPIEVGVDEARAVLGTSGELPYISPSRIPGSMHKETHHAGIHGRLGQYR